VYFLGDLFDSWIGDDQLREPLGEHVALGMRNIANAGVPVAVMNGNRDFLLGERFTEVAGATLLPEQIVINLAGTPTLLLHGDELCTADLEYQRYRGVARNARYQRMFLAFPYVLRRGFAGLMRRRSKATSAAKPESVMDVEHRAVEAAFRSANVTRIIHGHTHRPARHHLVVDGRNCERWVLADWYEHGSYLEFDEEGGRTHDV
jgi:UDP-2,3-diacylglucosamine hydrolase